MADLAEGAVFAGHRIEGVAGRGGMGTVYRATHLALDHMVALKVIASDLAGDASFRERFKSESRIAVSLRHPNVVPIHHAGEEQGLLFVTMDLIEGPDLRALLISRGPLEPAQAIAILEQVAAALDVAHSRGLVHRDIKPGNILIEDRPGGDHAFLTDFGLTKRMDQASEASGLTSTGAFVGTLDYVAPEQIRGERLDARTDVYALGCVLYEMLAARAPFADREEKVAKMYAHLQDGPEPLGGGLSAFDDVVARAMAKERERRFPSAGDLARAARAALEGGRVHEAERSVATGPAAPTEAYEVPGVAGAAAAEPGRTVHSEPPLEETVESEAARSGAAPTASEESAPASDAAAPAHAGRTAAGHEPPTRRQPIAADSGRGSRRSRVPLLVAVLLIAAAVGGGALLLSGGGDSGGATTTSGGGSDRGTGPVATVAKGGVPGGQLPVGVAVAGGEVFIADRKGFQVLKGDAKTFAGGPAVTTFAQPEDLIVSHGSVWVTEPKGDRVLRLSRDLGEQATISLPPGSEPSGIAAGEGKIWVTNQGTGTVTEIDPDTGATDEVPGLGAERPHGIAVAGGSLWVVDRDAGTLLQHDLMTGLTAEPIAVGSNPKGVAVAGGIVWVANTDSGTVSLIDETDGSEIGTPEVGGQPRAVDVFDGRVWVSNGDAGSKDLDAKRGWLSVFDAGGGHELLQPKLVVGGSPEGLGVGAGRVWVATGPQRLIKAVDPG